MNPQIITLVASIAFAIQIVLYFAIACGAPIAYITLSGNKRQIGKEARGAFFASVITQAIALVILLQSGFIIPQILPGIITRIIAVFFALFLSFSAFKIICGPNALEKKTILPLTLIAAAGFWYTITNFPMEAA